MKNPYITLRIDETDIIVFFGSTFIDSAVVMLRQHSFQIIFYKEFRPAFLFLDFPPLVAGQSFKFRIYQRNGGVLLNDGNCSTPRGR